MQFRFPRRKGFTRETSSAIWIAVPVIIVGLGLAVYLRRKNLAESRRSRRRWMGPEELPVLKTPPPTDEWVSEPQVQSEVPTSLAGAGASVTSTAFALVDDAVVEEERPRADEFVIPNLVGPSAKLDAERSATSQSVQPAFESVSQ